MAALNISLPDQVRIWLEEQVQQGRYRDASEYIEDLIRQDQSSEKDFQRLQASVEQGLASGASELSVEDIWNGVKSRHGNG